MRPISEVAMNNHSRENAQSSGPGHRLLQIPLDRIEPNPHQPRKHFDNRSLAKLASTIEANGVLQPVLVKREGEAFVLAAGERRFRAARMAGLAEIPALLTDQDPLQISLLENLQRRDLNPIEEAEGYMLLADHYGYTHQQIARKVGKTRSVITETLSLNRLPEVIKEQCRTSDSYSKCLLLEVVRQRSRPKMLALWDKIRNGGLTVRQARHEAGKRPLVRCRSVVIPPLRTLNRLEEQLSRFDCTRLTEEERESFGVRLVAVVEKLQELIVRLGFG